MTSEETSRARIREIAIRAAVEFDVDLVRGWEGAKDRINDAMDSQRALVFPAALHEYLMWCGEPKAGLWTEFSRSGGFSVSSLLGSRLASIETAISSGSDWQMFRRGAPIVTIKWTPSGTALWLPFDCDAADPDHDPPVMSLTERDGARPVQRADSFSSYFESMVEEQIRHR